MNVADLAAIEARMTAATGRRWSLAVSSEGVPVVRVEQMGEEERYLRVTRERTPASIGDVAFIANARSDIQILLAASRRVATPTWDQLNEIEARFTHASPPPWRAFLEEDGGLGGCNVIVVSEDEREPDLYLWFGDQLAPGADFEFVAAARQDIPYLFALVKHQTESDRVE